MGPICNLQIEESMSVPIWDRHGFLNKKFSNLDKLQSTETILFGQVDELYFK